MVRLRPHHLLCILTYVGEGYTPAFVRNFDAVVQRLAEGAAIAIAEGPDDLCGPILGESLCHCFGTSVSERDRLAQAELAAFLPSGDATDDGLSLNAPLVGRLRAAFAADGIRSACRACPWDALCTAIAAGGYAGVKLRPSVAA